MVVVQPAAGGLGRMSKAEAHEWLTREYDQLQTRAQAETDELSTLGNLMVAMHGGLVAFSAGWLQSAPLDLTMLVSAFGLMLALTWIAIWQRLSTYYQVHVDRLTKIEEYLDHRWPTDLSIEAPMTRRRMPERLRVEARRHRWSWPLRMMPMGRVFLAIPTCIICYWIAFPFVI